MTRPLAPWWARAVARAFDGALFLYVVGLLWVEVFRHLAPEAGDGPSVSDVVAGNQTTVRVLVVVASLLSEVVPTAIWGRTFGKALLGLRVVDPDDEQPPGWARAFGRWVLLGGALAVPVVGVPAFALVVGAGLLDRRRRGLHDRLAGTVVVSWPVERAGVAREAGDGAAG